MRPIRHIICDRLRYKYTSITQDENRFVVRVLVPTVGTFEIDVSSDCIMTTDSLLNKCLDLNGVFYKVVAEGIFDKRTPVGKKWWTPGSNIMFYCTPASVSMGIVEVCQKGGLTMGTKEKSNELGHRLGHTTFAQIFCRNANDSVIETAKSITSDSQGIIFTNIDMSNADVVSPEFVNNNPDASKYLNLQYHLSGPDEVLPNQLFECELHITKEMKNIIADDVDGDFVLEAVDGYLPHNRVHVEKGVGKFKACALMLNSGETMRIKVGTKTFSGHSELIVKVK
jgi:hypothetical protein